MSDVAVRLNEMHPDRRAFTLGELCYHLQQARLWEELEALLTKFFFLEARVQAGQLFELLDDYTATVADLPEQRPMHRILWLLSKALRRNAHFISNHPATLFQCLWNDCWWFDSPEVANHFPVLSNFVLESCPWSRRGWKLYALLDDWRRRIRKERKGWTWLRALRPPSVSLDSQLISILRGSAGVMAISISADSGTMAVFAGDNTIDLWNPATGKPIGNLRVEEQGHTVPSMALDPTGKFVITGHYDNCLRKWDTLSNVLLDEWQFDWHSECLACSPDGSTIASGVNEKVLLLDAQKGTVIAEFARIVGTILDLTFSADGRMLAASSADGMVVVFDLRDSTTTILRQPPTEETARWTMAWNVSLSGDGRLAAAACGDNMVFVWNVSSGALVRSFDFQSEVDPLMILEIRVALSPSGKHVAVSVNEMIWVHNLQSGDKPVPYGGHEGPIFALEFMDSTRLVSSGLDHSTRIWDTTGKRSLIRLPDTSAYFAACAFTPDGATAVALTDLNLPVSLAIPEEQITLEMNHTNAAANVEFGCRLDNGQALKVIIERDDDITFFSTHPRIAENKIAFSEAWYKLKNKGNVLGSFIDFQTGEIQELRAYSKRPNEKVRDQIMTWNGSEMTVVQRTTGEEIAWYPESWLRGAMHPSDVLWAGTTHKNLSLIRLEVESDNQDEDGTCLWYQADQNADVGYDVIFQPGRLATLSEMSLLPRWAKLAFAARCGRYVQMAFVEAWPEATHNATKTLEDGLIAVEKGQLDKALFLIKAVTHIVNSTNELRPDRPHDAQIAYSAASATLYAVYALKCVASGADNFLNENVVDASVSAVNANPALVSVLRGDFNRLTVLAQVCNWTDKDQTPLYFFLDV